INRRKFIKISSALSAALVATPSLIKHNKALAEAYAENDPDVLETDSNVKLVHSVCLMCHSNCGTRGRVKDNILVKIDGNPYHPNCMEPDERLNYSDDPASDKVKKTNGRLCPKGLAGIQTIYDPYRIKNPLKKIGDRDSGQWEEISWSQAIDEIADILKDIWDNDTDIDPNFPEYGKIANKLVFSAGRIQHGQKEFTDRIFKNGFGTANYRHDHTSICEVSHHTGGDLLSDYQKNHWKPDIINCKYIIWWGANPLEASFPMNALARKMAEFLKDGGKMDVVDPLCTHSALKAIQTGGRWVAIKPGTDAALALGMARWILDNEKYDEGYLKLTRVGKTNTVSGLTEPTYTDATYLVDISTGQFLTAEDAGLTEDDNEKDKNVVWEDGEAKISDTVDAAEILPGVVVVNGKTCKTAFEIYKESVEQKTVSEYAAICDVDATTIQAMASEFTSHGKKAVVNPYRGPVQHTNGTYTFLAIASLNMLIGNYDWKGGNTTGGSHWHEAGTTGTMDLANVPNGVSPDGIPISRHGKEYESDAPNIFARDGYPAKRIWTPLNSYWNYQEILPSIDDGYPYQIDTLVTYWNNILYSVPAGKEEGTRILKDKTKIPHFIAFDILIGETASLADYILPDTTHLERWSTPHVSPAIVTKTSGVRQPYVGTYDGAEYNYYVSYLSSGNIAKDLTTAEGPQLLEDILIALAKKLEEKTGKTFPGVGTNAFELIDTKGNAINSGKGWTTSLNNAWDYYKNILINFTEESGIPEDYQEILDKGGVFADSDNSEYDGEYIAKKYGGILHFHIEELATTNDSQTGKPYDSLGIGAKYEAVQGVGGTEITTDSTYAFSLITYKPVIHAQSRTINNPWLQSIVPENFVEMNEDDAASLGIETGDSVKITSKDGVTMTGKARTRKIKKGVVAIAHSYGHWEMASKAHTIDGVQSDYDEARGLGIASSPVMMLDPDMGVSGLGSKNVCLQDRVGGSASFYDSPVKIEKV
ncbi:MAG: hypothetical protein A2W17_11500, partial [Planctomycetes bacterium RBG_16_41_13]